MTEEHTPSLHTSIDVVLNGVKGTSLLTKNYASTVSDRFEELEQEVEKVQNEVDTNLHKAEELAAVRYQEIDKYLCDIRENIQTFTGFMEYSPFIFQISKRQEYIDIHYFSEDCPKIGKIEKGDWIDLYAAEDVIIPVRQYRLIPLGISMKLPEMYEAYVLPRSSTFKNWGIIMTNSQAVIDNSYNGTNDQWMFCGYCLQPKADGIYTDESDSKLFRYLAGKGWGNWVLKHFCRRKYEAHQYTLVKKGDKICQFRIQEHMPNIYFAHKDTLNDEDRGGIGSTGTR